MSTVTKADFIEQVYQKIGFSKKEAQELVEAVFEIMKNQMLEGESVKISGFGTFVVRSKKPRRGRNPQTGERIMLLGRLVVTFRPSHMLRAAINGEALPKHVIDDLEI